MKTCRDFVSRIKFDVTGKVRNAGSLLLLAEIAVDSTPPLLTHHALQSQH